MFNSISWSQYIVTIALLLVLYYLFVGFKYYHWEILNLIGIRKVETDTIVIPAVHNQVNPVLTEKHEDYLPKPALDIDISPVVQSFTDEVMAYLNEAKPSVQQNELLYSLQLIASKYPALKDADCKDELLQAVLNEVNHKYPGLLESVDLITLWN
jgi:hypothetical protein